VVATIRNEHTNSYIDRRKESSRIPLKNSVFSGISVLLEVASSGHQMALIGGSDAKNGIGCGLGRCDRSAQASSKI
jgi:hypothetical protein